MKIAYLDYMLLEPICLSLGNDRTSIFCMLTSQLISIFPISYNFISLFCELNIIFLVCMKIAYAAGTYLLELRAHPFCLFTGSYELVPYYKGENTVFDVSPSSVPVNVKHQHVTVPQKFQVQYMDKHVADTNHLHSFSSSSHDIQ